MAENKQYITQLQENGSLLISEEVISTIAAHAISEVEGIVSVGVRSGADIVEMISKKNWGKGIKVTIDENDEVTISCNVVIVYGQSVVTVAKAAQDAVSAAVESMTGVTVAGIHVNVCGIVRQ